MRWAGHVARVGEKRGAYRIWWGKLREVDHLEDPGGGGRDRWEDNTKMDLQEVGCGSMGWIELAQDRDR